MIEPTIRGIRQCLTQSDSVLLLGTSATIQAGFYERAVSETGAKVCAIAIPELASAIDSGDIRAQTRAIEQHIDARVAGCSAALLLCTHFPLAADLISARLREVVGQPVVILSQDQWVCEYLKEKEIHSGIDTVAVTLVLTAPSSSIELQVRRRFPGSNVQAVLA
jgi:glutamate racemase